MIIKPKIINSGEDVGSGVLTIRFHYLDIENGKLTNKIAERYCDVGDTVTPPTIPTTLDAVTKQSCALTFKEWNYTNAQLTNIQTDIDVGAIYNTSDSKTHAFVTVNAGTGYDLPVYFNKSDSSTLTISWGDGTADYTTTNSGDITTTHTYSTAGSYEIRIWISSGTGTFRFGYNGGIVTCFIGGTNQTYKDTLNGIFMDGKITDTMSGAFNNAHSLELLTLSTNITTISTNCFIQCHKLKYVTLPTSVTSIVGFKDNYGLSFVSLSNSLTTINSSTFQGCYDLNIIIIPSSVNSMGTAVFQYCYSLKKVIFLANVSSLPTVTFDSCYSLNNVVILSNIELIYGSAFSTNYCANVYTIKRFTAPSTITVLDDTNVFRNITSQVRIYVPVGSEAVYKTATNWSSYANYIYEDNPTNRALFGD
jgi:hypothetical protein